jgi:ribonuclease G
VEKELYIDTHDNEVKIALLEDKVLVELHGEKKTDSHHVGDIFIGRIRKIVPGLNAAFVDIGAEKDAFLHYLDVGANIRTFNKYIKDCMLGNIKDPSLANVELCEIAPKDGAIKDVFTVNQLVLVQIAKEAMSTKGPRVTGEIALAGRYVILTPFNDKVMVSKKITSSTERNRLRRSVYSIKPPNMGIIVRTVAKGQDINALRADMRALLEKWKEMVKIIGEHKFPQKVISELDKVSALLRDVLNDTFDAIYVNEAYYPEIHSYIQLIAPERADIVKLYKGKETLFEHYGIDRQIRGSFGKNVSIKGGIYIIIEHTEALHVIDVNSGHRMSSDNTQEINVLEVNLQAAVEIARQLRLRDMGGIIVIDFIDMRESEHRRELFERIATEMQKDKARHKILPPNKFGLVQITRQRVRPQVSIEINEKCPSCNGTGMVRQSILIIEDIVNNLQLLVNIQKEKKLILALHPFLYAYLSKHFYPLKWLIKYKCCVKLQENNNLQFLEYKFYNKKLGEINLWQSEDKKYLKYLD